MQSIRITSRPSSRIKKWDQLRCRSSPNILKYRGSGETFQQSRKQDNFRQILKRVQLVFEKVQAHNSLEPALDYNQDQMPLMNQGSL